MEVYEGWETYLQENLMNDPYSIRGEERKRGHRDRRKRTHTQMGIVREKLEIAREEKLERLLENLANILS